MSTNYKKLGDYVTQRREKNTAINLPICGVCREGLFPLILSDSVNFRDKVQFVNNEVFEQAENFKKYAE